MEKLLIVDDEEIELDGMAELIDWPSYGYELVGTAINGKRGLALIQEKQPDIVITDIKMPVMDGMSALQIIHARWPKTQIILLSGHADMQLAVQAMSEGAFGYLMKPVDIDELLFKIEDAVTQIRLEAGQG